MAMGEKAGTPGSGSGRWRRYRVEVRQVDDDRLLGRAGDDHHRLNRRVRVLLAMWHEGRDEHVVSRFRPDPHLTGIVARALQEHELRVTRRDVDRSLRFAVVMVGGPDRKS